MTQDTGVLLSSVLVVDARTDEQRIADLESQVQDLKKELEIALPIMYALFEHVQAMNVAMGGLKSRWERDDISHLYREYVDRKRAIVEGTKTPP
jgi:hypothetical protein